MSWREQMEDLAASVWTNRKASPGDVRSDIAKAIGVKVPSELENALETLADEEVRQVLLSLNIEFEYAGQNSELCVECYRPVGGCEEECGQYEEAGDGRVDLPKTETAMVSALDELLESWLDGLAQPGTKWSVETFKEAEILTSNQGLVVKLPGAEFQITVVKSG